MYGVDGKLVVMVRRPPERAAMVDRQLSFNCPRYITVGTIIVIRCLRFNCSYDPELGFNFIQAIHSKTYFVYNSSPCTVYMFYDGMFL